MNALSTKGSAVVQMSSKDGLTRTLASLSATIGHRRAVPEDPEVGGAVRNSSDLHPYRDVRFLARRSIYFWVSQVIWILLSVSFMLFSATGAVESQSVFFWAGCATAIIWITTLALAVVSGIRVYEDGSVQVRDGLTSYRMVKGSITSFVTVSDVPWYISLLLLLSTGSFVPNRVALRIGRDHEEVRAVDWCFANDDAARAAARTLNRALRETQST